MHNEKQSSSQFHYLYQFSLYRWVTVLQSISCAINLSECSGSVQEDGVIDLKVLFYLPNNFGLSGRLQKGGKLGKC